MDYSTKVLTQLIPIILSLTLLIYVASFVISHTKFGRELEDTLDESYISQYEEDGYHEVIIGEKSFYEKDEDSNYQIAKVVSKDKSFLESGKVVLLLENESGNSAILPITKNNNYTSYIDKTLEKSYVRKVIDFSHSAITPDIRYFVYLTQEDNDTIIDLLLSTNGLESTQLSSN
jgi:hypothetical protein